MIGERSVKVLLLALFHPFLVTLVILITLIILAIHTPLARGIEPTIIFVHPIMRSQCVATVANRICKSVQSAI